MIKPPNNELKRSGRSREANETIFILTEGHTEFNYLNSLIKDRGIKHIQAGKKKMNTPVELSKHRKKDMNGYAHYYCVFDRDEHPKFEQTVNELGEYAIYSIPCFEYWLLLHIKETTKTFSKIGKITASQQMYKEFSTQYKSEVNKNYNKTDSKIYSLLMKYLESQDKKIEDVISRSKRIFSSAGKFGNPSTNFHKIVEKIIKNANK